MTLFVININTIIGRHAGHQFELCSFLTYTHIVKLLYKLHSRMLCYPKIKLNHRVLDFVCVLCLE